MSDFTNQIYFTRQIEFEQTVFFAIFSLSFTQISISNEINKHTLCTSTCIVYDRNIIFKFKF